MDRWQGLAEQVRPPNTLIVNLWGGPGTGKSTTAALLYGSLKQEGINAELVTEFAKDLVWEKRHATLEDQIYIFGKQVHRVERLRGQVEVVVTDAPILMAEAYTELPELVALARRVHNDWNTLDALLHRDNDFHPYAQNGRYQTLQGAQILDAKLRDILFNSGQEFVEYRMGPAVVPDLTTYVLERLRRPANALNDYIKGNYAPEYT